MSSIIDFTLIKDKIIEALDNNKEKEVLFSRFGLDGKKIETLENIGKRFNVTRERIRQIEKSVIKKIKNDSSLSNDFTKLYNFIQKKGGIISESRLQDLTLVENNSKVVLNIMLVSSPNIIPVNNKYFQNVWAIDSLDIEYTSKLAKTIFDFLKNNKRVFSINEIIKSDISLYKLNSIFIKAIVESCSLIGADSDGKYGLMSWGIIRPKNTRDRAYVVLKSIKKPLHYKKLTELICKEDFSIKKKVSIEAVHNELIRDTRFVLVGRGIYALKEWGYDPGTVSDVIEDILKKSGKPMHKNDIITKVLERRFVRKNTILLNLQEKPQFERVVRAVYKLKGN